MPVVTRPAGRMAEYLHDVLHFPIFAALTWTLWSRRRSRWLVLGAIVAAILLVERLQPWVGREAEVRDALFGLAGAVTVGVFHAAAGTGHPRRRGAWRGIGIAVMAAVVGPLLLIVLDRWEARRVFPLLASFRSPLEIGRWTGQGCGLKRVRRDGQWALRLEVIRSPLYPGAFLVEAPRDWSRMQALQITLFWPGSRPREFWVRADDRPDSPPYADRVQTAFTLNPGFNRLFILRSALQRTPGGRLFNFAQVISLGLFLGEAAPGDTLDILEVRLILDGVRPGEPSQ